MRNWGLLALRVAVGIVFIRHGWLKLTGIDGVEQMVASIGFPLPVFFAWVLALVEFVGGIAVLVGAYLRVASKLLALDMLIALLLVHSHTAFAQAELAIVLLGGVLALFLLGGGDFMLTKKDCGCKMCKS